MISIFKLKKGDVVFPKKIYLWTKNYIKDRINYEVYDFFENDVPGNWFKLTSDLTTVETDLFKTKGYYVKTFALHEYHSIFIPENQVERVISKEELMVHLL